MNPLSKIIFHFKKPEIIIVTGEGKSSAIGAIYQVLKNYFKVEKISGEGKTDISLTSLFKNRVFLFKTSFKNIGTFRELINRSKLPILVITRLENCSAEEINKIIPNQGFLVLNFDNQTGDLKSLSPDHLLTFGLQEGADIKADHFKLNKGTNFKITHKGNIVPIWLKKLFGKRQIYSALAATGVGVLFNLNLVEISQALRAYKDSSNRRG